MAREFRPVRFFVLMAVVVFLACAVVGFFSNRASYGRTPEQREAYASGFKAGEDALRDAKLPTAAGLNMMAQARFEKEGKGDKSDWDLAFERGYEAGFRKSHPTP
jgi:hypothetical protein